MDDTPLSQTVEACFRDLAAGDETARARILELCSERLRLLTRRMLRGYPAVKRWEDTDDVFQNASLRLYRCLGQVSLESPREIFALAATQIHRELIDLARHHAGPMSFSANHATGYHAIDDHSNSHHPQNKHTDTQTTVDRWSRFHEAIELLPAEQREVFQFVWYLGADQKTVARLVGCSVRTIKSRWRDARESIRTALNHESPE
jgi:RNA polymerase sigma-70 factor (ECF subfamily)